jgi:hypothetical protein
VNARDKDKLGLMGEIIVDPVEPLRSIDEPQPEWIPLSKAPFFCFPGGMVRSREQWQDKVIETAQQLALCSDVKADEVILEPWGFDTPENWSIAVTYGEITSVLSLDWCFVFATICINSTPAALVIVFGSFNTILELEEWSTETENLSEPLRKAINWHKEKLLRPLIESWYRNFALFIKSGSASIFARQNSVLTPFGRVTWDQWHFFRIDEHDPAFLKKWCYPWQQGKFDEQPCSATGPAGERLFAIYVAPGPRPSPVATSSPDEKCRQSLMKLLRDFPDRPPKPLNCVFKDLISEIAGLSEKRCRHIYLVVATETGNLNWSRPGRPSAESQHKSPRQK